MSLSSCSYSVNWYIDYCDVPKKISEGCISNRYYDLYVYDVENDNTLSQLPAIIKNQVFVEEQTTATSSLSISPILSSSTS